MQGGFTLPGESGYEELTLKLAKKWGADVIRDSDGTVLSDEILKSGYGIYSTICIIRDHNSWAKQNLDKLQQTFLMTPPKTATESTLSVNLLENFFREQFEINDSNDSLRYWQVWDRTNNTEIPRDDWKYENGIVTLQNIIPFHNYTVSFMAYRIWEEISMYNHTTNHWDKEHLMQIDPRHEETQAYLKQWMTNWCENHPATTVVRFTSMFYNFVWIWGSDDECRNLYADWASYDFTVSPKALDEFKQIYGYELCAEDFINQGKLNATHSPGDRKKRDWMEFIHNFVVDFGKELIDIVHKYGKAAYVFYDDSWVGVEPYGPRFKDFGFDGLIKCVFSGYEARLCAGVDVPVHELRLHPYLFPVGLGGLPTFMEGGHPTLDAKHYWIHVRRALLRAKIDRIGLGGYLHLTEDFPDFCDYIEEISDEFRTIRDLHASGKPMAFAPRIAVLHDWGKIRSWSLSGHFHETYMHTLIHINEALSGLPFEVKFIDFQDVLDGVTEDADILINAGRSGSAWSGGDAWKNENVIEKLTEWVWNGGVFLGVGEPSATTGYDTFFRMAHVLGVDLDTGARVCHGKRTFRLAEIQGVLPDGYEIRGKEHLYLTSKTAKVHAESNGIPTLVSNAFGKGYGIYLSDFSVSLPNIRMLMNLFLAFSGKFDGQLYLTDNPNTECAWYPKNKTLIVINNSEKTESTSVKTDFGTKDFSLKPFATEIMSL